MDKAKIIRISHSLELDNGWYRFIIWDSENQINVKIFDIGEWANWDKFVSTARLYIDRYQDCDYYDFDDELPEGSPERNTNLLIEVTRIKPNFVEQAEKVIERRKKGPVAVFFYKLLDKFVYPQIGRAHV